MSPSIAILAGGRSRRMGRDKGTIQVAGVPMLGRVLDAARATGLPVMVVGRSDLASIVAREDVRCVGDDDPGSGPLGAIATALRATGGSVIAVACDMPFVTPGALLWLADQASAAGERHGVITLNDGRREPLFSVYAPTALPLIEALFARGERALRALIAAGDFLHAEIPHRFTPALLNINTPEDLRGIEGMGERR